MKYIAHRINKVSQLVDIPSKFDVEIDNRSSSEGLYLSHDPFVKGEIFKQWLKHYRHEILILNVKEDGLEEKILDELSAHSIENYFFLDQPIPSIVKFSSKGIAKCATRFSEYESIESILKFEGRCEWVWIDCFSDYVLDASISIDLEKRGFKLCVVSPELQGRFEMTSIHSAINFFKEREINFQAVCSKYPEVWRNAFE